ncbi:MAG TPA: protein-methionine-sulfoxide reductase catalytic subunit MsrP [Tepidisphaeraceae bacterium]|nr:protein-methionine-sulfoxide reductase catalytic subunit MsrP [Tepidisphaeraceae bacterium]
MAGHQRNDIPSSEITDESVYFNRRTFMRAGIVAATALATGLIYRKVNHISTGGAAPRNLADLLPTTAPATSPSANGDDNGFRTNERLTPFDSITHYNNFYEFSLDKESVAEVAENFKTRPWTVSVEGLVSNPMKFDLDDLLKLAPIEERVYRMRCVEAWSMVIPWAGYSLSKLLEKVQPLSSAKYVAFESVVDPKQMPNQRSRVLDWPYVEGLRMDEAMHPLAILATGLYGKQLPPQDGAPIRLVTPWKYGFKGAKSIVKIKLVEEQPPSTWNLENPREYGFYANVNPEVDHPRWSQATERRIGEGKRETLMFNGYADQVAHLYAGMDLRANY